MVLPFAFPDQERYEKLIVISYPMQFDGSGHNIPGLTSKGMLISWNSTGNLKYKISIVCLHRRLFELLYLGPILAYELRGGTLNLSLFICYTSVGFSSFCEALQGQLFWCPVTLWSLRLISRGSWGVTEGAAALNLVVGPGGTWDNFYLTSIITSGSWLCFTGVNDQMVSEMAGNLSTFIN